MAKIEYSKSWYLICPTCAWFAPFAYDGDKDERPFNTRCDACGTTLLWKGIPIKYSNFMESMEKFDPAYNDMCGNHLGGFTSKLALTFIWSQNDIEWWKGNA